MITSSAVKNVIHYTCLSCKIDQNQIYKNILQEKILKSNCGFFCPSLTMNNFNIRYYTIFTLYILCYIHNEEKNIAYMYARTHIRMRANIYVYIYLFIHLLRYNIGSN
jgi:hypothetical protein